MSYVTKVNDHKRKRIESLKNAITSTRDFIFADYRGMTVAQMSEMRRQLRECDTDCQVIKNRFARIAFQQLDIKGVADILVGPTALLLSRQDGTLAFKVLTNLDDSMPVSIKGAIIDGAVFNQAEAMRIAKLPSRDGLLGQLLSVINAPMRQFAQCLNETVARLPRVIKAYVDLKK